MRETIDFAVFAPYTRYGTKQPICFVEISPPQDILRKGTRASADLQMRERFDKLQESCDVPTLYGFSFMGSMFSSYTWNVETSAASSRQRSSHKSTVTDSAPADWWRFDILTDSGRDTFLNVIQEIKKGFAQATQTLAEAAELNAA